jgi:sulfonate transport system substrate-binding protein
MKNTLFTPNRRQLIVGVTALLSSGMSWSQPSGGVLRIGYQKSSVLITVLKAKGTLESLLAAKGIKVSWHEFTSGLPLLEALNLGNVDFSADVADTVPVFAQAAGARLTYIAQEAPSPTAQAIVVRQDSLIRQVIDLKGKKVGLAKAAGAHYLLIAALEKVGLSFKDIEPAYLSPADGRAAFEKGAIDAWVVWDPFLSAVKVQSNARVIPVSRDTASYQRYYLATDAYAKSNPDVLRILYQELKKAGAWVKKSPKEAAVLLAGVWGIESAIVEQANTHRSYEVREVNASGLAEQQKIADAFYAEKLLPKRIDTQALTLFNPL